VAKNDTKGSLMARLSNLQSIRNVAKKFEHEEQFMKFYVLYICSLRGNLIRFF
jgi:hypothetical protein